LWVACKQRRDWAPADLAAGEELLASLDRPARYRFCILPGIDGTSHLVGPEHEDTLAAYLRVDALVGELATALEARGAYDSTVILVASDHGHATVHTHFDVAQALEERFGLRTTTHPRVVDDPEAVACVSGNCMAMVSLRRPDGTWGDALTGDDL